VLIELPGQQIVCLATSFKDHDATLFQGCEILNAYLFNPNLNGVIESIARKRPIGCGGIARSHPISARFHQPRVFNGPTIVLIRAEPSSSSMQSEKEIHSVKGQLTANAYVVGIG
jgi:hypothetical protein